MAVHDFDWETQFCDSPYKEITRKIALSFCDGIKNGWIGRCLPRLFGEIGMTESRFPSTPSPPPTISSNSFWVGTLLVPSPRDVLSEHEANLWWTHLAQASALGTFLYGFTAFIVSGTKAA